MLWYDAAELDHLRDLFTLLDKLLTRPLVKYGAQVDPFLRTLGLLLKFFYFK